MTAAAPAAGKRFAPRRDAARATAQRLGARAGAWVLVGLVALILAALVAAPLFRLVTESLSSGAAWRDIATGDLSSPLLREPLANTLFLGVATGLGSVLLGGSLAWLVVMTDVPYRHLIGVLATIPFALPSFGLALVWESVFRNDLLGDARAGIIQSAGVDVPDWVSWGWLPIAVVLTAHYYPLVFLLAAAALASVKSDMTEAAVLTGASRTRMALGITMPVVRPALLSGFLLAFAEAVSNFAAPALLGLPVRYHTISTRVQGSIATGETERGFALAVVLIAVAGSLIAVNLFLTRRAKAFQTITGKGGRTTRLALGTSRWPLFLAALGLTAATTVIPIVILTLTTFSRRTASFAGGFTTHFWTGGSDPAIAQGQAGVLRNDQLLEALWTTLRLGLTVAALSTVIGLATGYVVARRRGAAGAAVGTLSFIPFLIPGLAFGAAFSLLFANPIGPIPALTGKFTLLVIAGLAITLPFSARAGASAMTQVGSELEEAAVLAGAGFMRRLKAILFPLVSRGLIAGALLAFVKIIGDLAMVIMLASPTTTVLTVIAFRYASDGFSQLANATLLIVIALSVLATVLSNRLERPAQPWSEATA